MAEKKPSQSYKYLMILALHQEFIDKKIFADLEGLAKVAEDKPRAIMEFLQEKHLTPTECKKLLALYKVFMTRQENIRFGALAVAFGFIKQKTVPAVLEKQKEIFKKTGHRRKIGEILVAADALSKKQRDLVLLKQQRDFSIKLKRETAGDDLKEKKSAERKTASSEKEAPGSKGQVAKQSPQPKTESETSQKEPGNKTPQIDTTSMTVYQEKGLELLIQADTLKAFLKKVDKEQALPEFDETKEFLQVYGVIYGLVDDKLIQEFLKPEFPPKKLFQVAEGLPMKESKDACIEYFIDEQFLNAGKVNKDGTMDFMDRGMVPTVKEGSLLAKKQRAEAGEIGANVFGEHLTPLPATDLDLTVGDGAVLSEDKLEIRAEVDGFPKKDLMGCVSVVQEYYVSGDVDFHTGHIEFDGNVTISGTIKPGFKVSGNTITVDAVEGGIITCEGDVVVKKGILDAQVFSRGTLAASFVHNSNITCMGNLNVTKEILDSKVVLDGFCMIGKGRILSSDVTAKEGIWVMNVGTKGSRNSVLTAGASEYADMEIKRVEALVKKRQEILDLKYSDKKEIESQKQQITEKIDETEAKKKNSLAMIEELEAENDAAASPIKIKMLENHKKHVDAIDQESNALKDEANMLEKRTGDLKIEIDYFSKAVQKHVQEMLVLKQINNQGTTPPKIEIDGQVLSGTKLCGRHSFAFVQDTMTRVRIKELAVDFEEDEPAEWELVIEPK